MSLSLKKINYADLNSRQQEHYNFQKISAVLADYGYVATFRLSDDWQGADFIAQHIDGKNFLKVQLKGRLTFDKKYIGKDIYVTFFEDGIWHLYPHDQLSKEVSSVHDFMKTVAWLEKGMYSFSSIPKKIKPLLDRYSIKGDVTPGEYPD